MGRLPNPEREWACVQRATERSVWILFTCTPKGVRRRGTKLCCVMKSRRLESADVSWEASPPCRHSADKESTPTHTSCNRWAAAARAPLT
jgi:hypothetical protein